jgi:hypothetical protein
VSAVQSMPMNLHSDKTYRTAFNIWWTRSFLWKKQDLKVEPFLRLDIQAYRKGDTWLRDAREASLIPLTLAAKKMEMTRGGFSRLEDREQTGKINLELLAKAAEAIDCELVYAIRPKKRMRFSVFIWKNLVEKAETHSWVRTRVASKQAQALAKIATELFQDPQFRREHGWTERRR